MLLQLMGFLDIIAGINLVLLTLGISFYPAIIACAAYLIIKGLMFIMDIASLIDLSAGIVLLLAYFFSIPTWILFLAALLIIQKGIFSMISVF